MKPLFVCYQQHAVTSKISIQLPFWYHSHQTLLRLRYHQVASSRILMEYARALELPTAKQWSHDTSQMIWPSRLCNPWRFGKTRGRCAWKPELCLKPKKPTTNLSACDMHGLDKNLTFPDIRTTHRLSIQCNRVDLLTLFTELGHSHHKFYKFMNLSTSTHLIVKIWGSYHVMEIPVLGCTTCKYENVPAKPPISCVCRADVYDACSTKLI